MAGEVYEHVVLIDSCAAIALLDPADQFHEEAVAFYQGDTETSPTWVSLSITAQETFTRVRYARGLVRGLKHLDFFDQTRGLEFIPGDVVKAREMLEKYSDHELSFHDALCAAVMLRVGIYRVFTFDADFWTFGFEVLPGRTGHRWNR